VGTPCAASGGFAAVHQNLALNSEYYSPFIAAVIGFQQTDVLFLNTIRFWAYLLLQPYRGK
jgi:hypothetical protein